MKIVVLFLIFLNSINVVEDKIYVKNYHSNGKLMEEGWILNNQKVDYWFYYYESGNKKEEGHYYNNNKVKWWIYYNENAEIIKKSEYKSDKLNGLTIIYTNGAIAKAEKYLNGKKVKTWTSISEFKKDNGYWF